MSRFHFHFHFKFVLKRKFPKPKAAREKMQWFFDWITTNLYFQWEKMPQWLFDKKYSFLIERHSMNSLEQETALSGKTYKMKKELQKMF